MKNKENMLQKVNRYVCHKQKLGVKFTGEAYLLASFGKYADRYFPGKSLSINMALEWVKTKPHLKSLTKLGHFCALRGLANYLKLEDPKTELIPKNIYKAWFRRMSPYIYYLFGSRNCNDYVRRV